MLILRGTTAKPLVYVKRRPRQLVLGGLFLPARRRREGGKKLDEDARELVNGFAVSAVHEWTARQTRKMVKHHRLLATAGNKR